MDSSAADEEEIRTYLMRGAGRVSNIPLLSPFTLLHKTESLFN